MIDKGDKRKERGEKTKMAIINAVMQIIAEEGKKGLTTRAIVERAGIGKGSLYHHFDNMDSIMEETIRTMHSLFINHFFSLEFSSVEDMLLKLGENVINSTEEMLRNGRGVTSLWDEVLSNKRLRDVVSEMNERYIDIISEKIRSLSDREPDPKRLRNTILSLMTFIAGMKNYLLLVDDFGEFRELWKEISQLMSKRLFEDRS